jgi:hypothetical protein
MRVLDFINQLGRIRNSYKWEIRGKNLVGIAKNGRSKGLAFTPIEAVARSTKFRVTLGNHAAAEQINFPETLIPSIVSPANRGFAQVLRGKMRQAVGAYKCETSK